ncbi:putative Alpha-(1,3)-fucosyltransferase C [Hypsibius exemplaris]|uniref:Fucosyltransferase n=1 Tax=Hypsibius exemplaris TaxID=2072580 RepID=A0A1W0XBS4_HYPEX|nr:putative Alpha-(1,3)-fucosyltransferase C [Hypsibius exemplaris]
MRLSSELSIVIAVLFSLLNVFFLYSLFQAQPALLSNSEKSLASIKLINDIGSQNVLLFWTNCLIGLNSSPVFNDSDQYFVHNCNGVDYIWTDDRALANISSVVIFCDMNLNDLPAERNSGHFYVQLDPQPFQHSSTAVPLPDFFNSTLTYTVESDDCVPYNRLQYYFPTALTSSRQFDEIWAKKSRNAAVTFVDDCSSMRMRYVHELRKYYPVDVYGRCENLTWTPDIRNEVTASYEPGERGRITSQYKFFLAFEESICQDSFSSDSLLGYLSDTVPVFLGGAHYSTIFPFQSFLNAMDFPSAKALAEVMHSVGDDKESYFRSFIYRLEKSRQHFRLSDILCTVCMGLRQRSAMPIAHHNDGVAEWWTRRDTLEERPGSAGTVARTTFKIDTIRRKQQSKKPNAIDSTNKFNSTAWPVVNCRTRPRPQHPSKGQNPALQSFPEKNKDEEGVFYKTVDQMSLPNHIMTDITYNHSFQQFFENIQIREIRRHYLLNCDRLSRCGTPKSLSVIMNGGSHSGFGSVLNNALNAYIIGRDPGVDRTFQLLENRCHSVNAPLKKFFDDFAVHSSCPLFTTIGTDEAINTLAAGNFSVRLDNSTQQFVFSGSDRAFVEMKEISVGRYVAEVVSWCKNLTSACPRNVFVMQDDEEDTFYKELKSQLTLTNFKLFGLRDILDGSPVGRHILFGRRLGDASDRMRNSREMVLSLTIMAMANYIMCTFSSNVCRLAALINGNLDNFRSLDQSWTAL